MRTIVDGNIRVKKVLGKQKPKDTVYRMMNYILRTECEDGVLLHNTITGQLSLLNSDEANILEQLPMSRTDKMTPLVEDYYLVPLGYDEKATVDNLRHIMKRLFTPKGMNGYTIMTTTNCNARCFYCYQAGYPHINMTEKTADDLVTYMVKNKGEDPLRLQWFGGEPLVGLARIDQICNSLNIQGVEFTSSMISNSYLFTEQIIDRAVREWKLKNIQVTIDGTEPVYNKTKAYVAADNNPFQRVLKNINGLLAYGVRVGVRLNLDQHNADDLIELLSDITELIPDRKLLTVYAHIVYEDEGYSPIARNNQEREKLVNKLMEINKIAIDQGLFRLHLVLPSLRYRSCMADNPRAVVVYPDGRLFKCEHTVLGDEFGNLDSSDVDESKIAKYTMPAKLKFCKSCTLYPSCFILKECDGVKDRNPVICKFETDNKIKALEQQYQKYLAGMNPETDNTEENDITEKC